MKQQFFSKLFSPGRKSLAAILLLISASSFAAGPNSNKSKTASDFSSTFSNASNVVWKQTSLYTEASFDYLNQKQHAYYDNDGNFYCLSKETEVAALPVNVLNAIQKKYPQSVATQAIELTNADEVTNYYVSVENAKASLILEVSKTGNVSVFKKKAK